MFYEPFVFYVLPIPIVKRDIAVVRWIRAVVPEHHQPLSRVVVPQRHAENEEETRGLSRSVRSRPNTLVTSGTIFGRCCVTSLRSSSGVLNGEYKVSCCRCFLYC